MAKSETLWRCSTCDKLHGSEKDALKCEEKHALFTLITTVYDNPTFEHVPVGPDHHDNIVREDIDDESYYTNVEKPVSLDDINTVAIRTYTTVVRESIYQRVDTKYESETKLFQLEDD